MNKRQYDRKIRMRSRTFALLPFFYPFFSFFKRSSYLSEYLKYLYGKRLEKKRERLSQRKREKNGIRKKNSDAFNLNPEMKYRHLRFLFLSTRFFHMIVFFSFAFHVLSQQQQLCALIATAAIFVVAAFHFVHVSPDFSVWFLFYTSIIFSLLQLQFVR